MPLAMLEPVPDNRNDLFEIEVQFEVVTATLEDAGILVEELFMNADAGFDSQEFRSVCEEKEINANICFNKRNGPRMDGHFRSILNRLNTTVESWKGLNYL